MYRKKIYKCFCVVVILLVYAAAVSALADDVVVGVSGDKLSIYAEEVPLQNILQRLSDQGINIRIDPQLNPKISAAFKDRDIRQGLDSILKSLNHILIWNTVEGPLGPFPRLAEIQIFETGRKELMRPLGKVSVLPIAKNFKDGSLYVKDEILVKFKPGTSVFEVKELLAQIGGRVVDSYAALGVYKIRLYEDADVPAIVERISHNPSVANAEPNYAYPVFKPYKPAVSKETPFEFSDTTMTGESVPVAVLDTGLNPVTALKGLILASVDAINPDIPIADPQGHGTQMALIAAGIVKPDGVDQDSAAKPNFIIPIKIFDDNGMTSGFHLMNSIEFAIKQGAKIMSLSWGSETKSDFLEKVLERASSKGLVVVASAGNEPSGKPFYPAAYPGVIGVGALDPDGKPWNQSNYGDFVSVYAPGFAALPVGYKGEPGVYAGTSISAAFVANQIAKYMAAHPLANVQDIYQAVRNHSLKIYNAKEHQP